MKHINLFLTCHKDQTQEVQINMLLFKNYLFITRRKKIRKQYKNNKLKIIAQRQNDEFKLPDGSYSESDIHGYIKYIIKKHKTLTTNPHIHIYVNRINNRLVLKIKDGYKLELQTPETMKLFASTKNLMDKTKKWRKSTIA